LARLVSKQELGSYQQLALIYSLVSPLLIGGIPTALQYFIPRSRTRREQRLWVTDTYLVMGFFGLIFVVLLIGLRGYIASLMNNASLSHAIVLYTPFVFFSFVAAIMPAALVSVRRARLSAIVTAAAALCAMCGVVAAALINPDVSSLAVGISIGSAAGCILSVVAVTRVLGVRWTPDRFLERGRRLLAFGLPLALTGLAGQIAFALDRLVVSAHFSPAKYAIYVVGSVELPIAVLIQQSANSVLIPALAARHVAEDHMGVALLWKEAIRKTSLIMLPLFAFFMIMAGAIVSVLFGPHFAESVIIFRIYLFLLPLRIATYGLIPQAIGKTSINFSASLVSLVVNAILAVAFVEIFGFIGPAIATPVATIILVAYYLVRLRPLVVIKLSELLPLRLILGNLALALVATLPLIPVLLIIDGNLPRLIIGSIIYILFFVAAARISGRITEEDWRRLRGVVRIPMAPSS
jgi:O-antigen/teichoic acid export membrane protein